MNAQVKRPKMPRMTNPTKSEGFAIGVTTEHYWLITGIAQGKLSNRSSVLEEIIEHYIKCVFSKEK